MKTYVVTGGAGFIGSHLVEALLERGEKVIVIDNFLTGKRANLDYFSDRITFREGTIEDLEFLKREFEGVHGVFHEAALPSVPRSIEDPLLSHSVNSTGTLNVLIAARDAGVQRVVYASSSSLYGDQHPDEAKHEQLCPHPLSPYGLMKLNGEEYCRLFYEIYGLETVSLRYFNVFGPRQDPQSLYSAVIPKFITAALKGEPVTVHGDGTQRRDFTYVANVVHANLLALTASREKVAGKAFNAACGGSVSLLKLIETIEKNLGKSIERQFTPPREGDIKISCADIRRAQEALGYEPMVSFDEGISKTIEWYKHLS